MIPGAKKIAKKTDFKDDDKKLVRIEAIINSMTGSERNNAVLINAQGSGTTVQDVNQLLLQFSQMQKAMKQMKKMGMVPGLGSNPFKKRRR